MSRTILHKPLGLFVIGLLLAIGLIIVLIDFIIWIINFGIKLLWNWSEISIFDCVLYGLFIIILFRYFWRRFIEVPPSLAFLNQFDDGPWLHWVGDPKTSMVINWITAKYTPTAVNFGTSPENLSEIVGKPGKIHRIYLNNLTPDTTYYYQVHNFGSLPELFSFQTAPQEPRPFSFLVIGDTQNGGGLGTPGWAYPTLAKSMQTQSFDLLMHVGDASEQGNDVRSWHAFLATSGDMLAQHPMHIAVGNHDTGTNYMKDTEVKRYPDEGANFDYLFGYHYQRPATENEMTAFKGRYFAFYYSNCLCLFLDSQNSKLAKGWNPQWAFLKDQLEKCPKDYWKIVFIHRPLIYLTRDANGVLKWGYENFTPFIQPILEQYGVDLVFQGHSHDYEVYHPPWKGSDAGNDNSPWFFISGGGSNDTKAEQAKIFVKDMPGFLKGMVWPHFLWVQITADQCKVRAIGDQNELLDSYDIQKIISQIN